MNTPDIITRQGARLTFTVDRADPTAESATFIMQHTETGLVINQTANYNMEGVAVFTFEASDTELVGVYEYQIEENFSSGSPDIYPNFDNCDGDCDLPTLEICESLPRGSS